MIMMHEVPYRFLITTFLNVSLTSTIIYDKQRKETLKTNFESSNKEMFSDKL